MLDRSLLYTAAFLRAILAGMSGVMLALYLSASGYAASEIGLLVALGLGAGVIATVVVAGRADRLGRRRTQAVLAFLTCIGGVGLAGAQSLPMIAAFMFVGMLNGKGRERGAAHAIDQALLPQLTDDRGRTRTFAWYNMCLDAGHAVGALMATTPAFFQRVLALDAVDAYQRTFYLYSGLAFLAALLPLMLSARVEPAAPRIAAPAPLSPTTRRRVVRLSALFSLDSLGGGLLTSALVSYWFFKRFDVGTEWLGPLFFAARIANLVSHLAAAWMARRIGLVNTMVFTHAPSSVLLVALAFAPTFPLAVVLFLLRELLVQMDVPTRQSYVMAIVQPEERTAAAGITTIVRNIGWMLGPAVAGPLMSTFALSVPLFAGAGLKLIYDGLLYRGFKKVNPPEEKPNSH